MVSTTFLLPSCKADPFSCSASTPFVRKHLQQQTNMLTASMVLAAVQAKEEKEQGKRVSPKGIANPAQTSCFPCAHMHSISKWKWCIPSCSVPHHAGRIKEGKGQYTCANANACMLQSD
eukprot:712880-Pelagomonas_calceolata.AAC.1